MVCVIVDDNVVESFGGILGGEFFGCMEEIVNVLIEFVFWEEDDVVVIGCKFGVNIDVCYWFECGVDLDYMMLGFEYVMCMVLDLCGGEFLEMVSVGQLLDSMNIIEFFYLEIKCLLGVDVF